MLTFIDEKNGEEQQLRHIFNHPNLKIYHKDRA
jgi:hypothetical protein